MHIPGKTFRHATTGLALAFCVAGCGGGGGGDDNGGGGDPVANRPPAFTSAATVSVPEDRTGTIYTAQASDPDGDSLTFTIGGGADATLFEITTAGALSFRTQPDFENPADADGNNVYLVQISVSDGKATATLSLSVTVTDVATGGVQVRRIGSGFASPLHAVQVPGQPNRMLVAQKGGLIRILSTDTGAIASTPFLDVSGQISTDNERGLLGLALAPDYVSSRTFYVFLTATNGDIQIRRYRTVGSEDRADPATADVILRLGGTTGLHNGGWLDFGPDGFLHIAIGDGGSPNASQNPSSLFGKILRIDVSGDAFPADPERDYRIPAGNPFAAGGGAPEVLVYGLRNPFRNSFDPVTGNLWIGDVGENAIEEINLVRPSDAGANFGWPIFEGTQRRQAGGTGLTMPVTEYGHGTGTRQGNSVTGGHVYRGPVEALQGLYIFGDFARGNIWSVPIAQLVPGSTLGSAAYTVRNTDFAPDRGTLNNIVSFGHDAASNLYIVDFDGELFRIERE